MEGPMILAHRRFQLRSDMPKGPFEKGEWLFSIDGGLSGATEQKLAEAWVDKGASGLDIFSGSFAMAAYHIPSETLYLVRSPTGARPLFWVRDHHRIAFCSEIPPLIELPFVSRDIAMENLAEYLSFRYIHAPRTLLKSVFAVEPGHLLRIQNNEVHREEWYRPRWRHVQDPKLPDSELLEQFNVHLRAAVERRLSGDNVGLLLSGGLDSSAILMHSSILRPDIPTFTVALDEHPMDESPFAARVAKVMGAENTIVRIQSRAVIDTLRGNQFDMGQPMPTPAAAIQFLFFQEIRNQVSVLLSGDGGDEVLAGRTMPQLAFRMAPSRRIAQLPSLAQRMIRGVSRRADRKDWAVPHDNFGQARVIGGSRVFVAPERVALLTDPGLIRPGIRESVLTRYYQEVDSDPINDILHIWQRGWLVEDSLTRADRASSAARIELRYPLLDTNLRHFCAQLSGSQKIRRNRFDFVGKWPLRQALLEHLPSKLVYRPKRSLLSPMDQWLRLRGADFARDQIKEVCADIPHIFLPKPLKQLLKEHLSGQANHGLKLWTVILFHLWWKRINAS